MTGPLGQTHSKNGRAPLPVVRQARGDSWPRVALGAGLWLSVLASAIASGWLRVTP